MTHSEDNYHIITVCDIDRSIAILITTRELLFQNDKQNSSEVWTFCGKNLRCTRPSRMLWPTAESTQLSLFLVKVLHPKETTLLYHHMYLYQVTQVNEGGLVKNYEWVLLVLLPVYFIK